jgi:hypothetical protein
MEQRITHACGHEQVHYLHGFTSQQDRKARWLQTTKCRTCFIADKQAEQTAAAACHGAAIAHLDLPTLVGTDRQVAWATTIRTQRLAAIIATPAAGDADGLRASCLTTDAKWWIDHRDLADPDLLAKGAQHGIESTSPKAAGPIVIAQAA